MDIEPGGATPGGTLVKEGTLDGEYSLKAALSKAGATGMAVTFKVLCLAMEGKPTHCVGAV